MSKRRTEHYKPDETFIVKLEIPIITSREEPEALVYDRHKIIHDYFDLSEDILKILKGRYKAFFYAQIDEDGTLNFDTERGDPPRQDW